MAGQVQEVEAAAQDSRGAPTEVVSQNAVRQQTPAIMAAVLLLVTLLGFQFVVGVMESYPLYGKMDLAAYYRAADLIRTGHPELIYTKPDRPMTPNEKELPTPYIYPPLLAVLMAPFTAMSFATAKAVWLVLSLLAVLAGVLFISVDTSSGSPKRWYLPLLCVFCVAFQLDAIPHDLLTGNVNCLQFSLIACSLFLSQREKDASAGALLGLSFAIKITPILFLAPFVFGLRWRVLVGFAATSVLLLFVTLLVAGTASHVAFLETFGSISTGSSYIHNQSIYGVVARFLEDTKETRALWYGPHLATPISRVLSILFLVPALAACWIRRRDIQYCYAIMAPTICLISPIAWRAHLVVLLLSAAWLVRFVGMLRGTRWSTTEQVLLIVCGIGLLFTIVMPGILLIRPVYRTFWELLVLARESIGMVLLWAVLLWLGLRVTKLDPASTVAS